MKEIKTKISGDFCAMSEEKLGLILETSAYKTSTDHHLQVPLRQERGGEFITNPQVSKTTGF